VELQSAAESEVIHYTLDGSDPLGSGQVYDEPLLLEEDTEVTLRAVASRPDWLPSAELTVDYRITGTLQPPAFSQPAGAYMEPVVLQLDAVRASSEIRFTVDGSEPGPQSAEYVEPIALPMNSTTTVRARALEEDWISSDTASATYHIYPPLEASADEEPLLDTTVDLVSGEELTFTVNGGEGDYQVTVEPNAAGVPGSIEHLGNGEYRFVAPDTGAFAGEYTVRITDPVTGWTGDFTVRVPLAIAAERSTLLGVHPELRDAAVVVRGASPGAMISLVIDGTGVSALDPAPAEDLPAQGNPATVLVRAAEVENDPVSVEATATATGLPDSEPLVLTALVGVVYRGELSDTWPQPLEGVQVFLREGGDSYTHPELGSLDVLSGEGGDFLLAAPVSAGVRDLLFRAPDMLDEVVDAGDCLGENGCAVQMSYLDTAVVPVFGLPGGVYTSPELADGLPLSGEGLIRYTLDDAGVTVDSPAYDLPLLLPAGQSTTVRARAYVERQNPSAEGLATYHVYPTLNVEFEGEPVESLTVGHGDSLTFQLDGGSGDWEVTAATNAAGMSGTLEQTVDGWRFTAPDQGAFAGRYTITVRDRITGAETALHVEVPLAVSAPRNTLLGGAPEWRELSLTVAGAEPGVTLYAVSSDAQAATVQNSAVASDDAAAGNPALILVTAVAGVSSDRQFTVGVSAAGGLEGIGPELLAMRGAVYVGEVEDTWPRILEGAEIVLQDGDAAYEHPELGSFSAQTDAQGRFELPAPQGDYQLRFSAVGLEPAVRPVADCDSLNGCLVQLEYAETAAAPVLAPPPGTYLPGQIADGVTLGGEGILRYTVDGLPVSVLASRYESPIQLANAATTELRVRAYEEGRNPSPEVGGAYLVYPEAVVSIDGVPVAAPELLPAGQSLSFRLEGGSGQFELHAQPNAQGVNGQLEQLSADQWAFHAPDSGAFAGTYRIVVTDLLTGRTTTVSVDVPLALEVSANALLAGADGRNNAYVTARGLHEGASFALSLTTDPEGQEDAVTVLSTQDPHRHLVVVDNTWFQAGVLELTGTSPGIEPGLAEIAVERPWTLSGVVTTLYGRIYTARLQLVRMGADDWELVLDASGEPFEAYTSTDGLFTLAVPPEPPGQEYHLLATSDGYTAQFQEISGCRFALCFFYLTLEEQVAAPRFSPPGGQFNEPREITLESTTADATIRYTLDGSDPVEGNGITGPSGLRVTLSRTTTIRARAEKAGLVASETVQAEFRFRPAQDGGFFDGRDNEGRGGLGGGGGGGALGPWTLLLLLLAGAARLGWYGRSRKQR
ncbi:MAG: chitobiase/beta-hexosaminidase C-terminal domain-containing protein, partial [Ectothiorhodospiraceae bacterium]|nr:chitobiase/beta-hexosaminidase C-terminal domain-containing protein [Ectothiorhodospiraceae bacterium]